MKAVVVYEEAALEARLQAASDQASAQQETVFLWQLRTRALLLDDGFQRQILNVVKQHESAVGCLKIDRFRISNTRRLSSGSAMQRSTSHDSIASLTHSIRPSIRATPSSSTTTTSPVTRQSLLRTSSASTSTSGTVFSSLVVFANPLITLPPSSRTSIQRLASTDEEMLQIFLSNSDARASSVVCDGTTDSCEVTCRFDNGSSVATVEVVPAPVKTVSRMQDKLLEYAAEGSQWPLSACILDPVRASVVCSGPSQMLEALSWFVETGSGLTDTCQQRLVVCRVKNKFAMAAEELHGGYRDIMVLMVYTEPGSKLRIIGEVQIQDKILYEYKLKVRNIKPFFFFCHTSE